MKIGSEINRARARLYVCMYDHVCIPKTEWTHGMLQGEPHFFLVMQIFILTVFKQVHVVKR